MSRKQITTLISILVFLGSLYSLSKEPPSPTTTFQATETTQSTASKSDYYKVTRVVDGDTFDVEIHGTVERIRLIGVNTPETVDPRKPVQCFGKEASEMAKKLLTTQQVRLVEDKTQGNKDKYGRLLRYVYLENGLFLNETLISQGFAHEYTYDTPYNFQKAFKQAEKTAQEQGVGLWNSTACN